MTPKHLSHVQARPQAISSPPAAEANQDSLNLECALFGRPATFPTHPLVVAWLVAERYPCLEMAIQRAVPSTYSAALTDGFVSGTGDAVVAGLETLALILQGKIAEGCAHAEQYWSAWASQSTSSVEAATRKSEEVRIGLQQGAAALIRLMTITPYWGTERDPSLNKPYRFPVAKDATPTQFKFPSLGPDVLRKLHNFGAFLVYSVDILNVETWQYQNALTTLNEDVAQAYAGLLRSAGCVVQCTERMIPHNGGLDPDRLDDWYHQEHIRFFCQRAANTHDGSLLASAYSFNVDFLNSQCHDANNLIYSTVPIYARPLGAYRRPG